MREWSNLEPGWAEFNGILAISPFYYTYFAYFNCEVNFGPGLPELPVYGVKVSVPTGPNINPKMGRNF